MNFVDSLVNEIKQDSHSNSVLEENFTQIIQKILKNSNHISMTEIFEIYWFIQLNITNTVKRLKYAPKDFEPDIFKASKKGNIESVSYLIREERINPLLRDEDEDCPIHYAVKGSQLDIVKYFIDELNIEIDIKGNEGRTPLHYACERSNFPIVEYIISKGANIGLRDNEGRTPLYDASYYGRPDILKYLISKRADKRIPDNDGYTPFDISKNDEIRQILR